MLRYLNKSVHRGAPFSRRIRRGGALFGVALLAAIGLVAAGRAPAAFACTNTNSPDDHCYAIYGNSTADLGVAGNLDIVCSYMPDNTYRVDQEIWDESTNGLYWTEVGVISGVGYNGTYYSKHWYWADSRPDGGGYNEHEVDGTANTETSYPIEIQWEGNDTWYAYGGNTYAQIGTSTGNPLTDSGYMNAGTEYTANSGDGMRDVGNIADLTYENLSDVWYPWLSLAYPNSGGPGYWITPSYNTSTSTVSWTGPC
jgi:hypothetical protein